MLDLIWLAGPFFVWRLMMKDGFNQPMVPSTGWARVKAAVGVFWYALWWDDEEEDW